MKLNQLPFCYHILKNFLLKLYICEDTNPLLSMNYVTIGPVNLYSWVPIKRAGPIKQAGY